MEKEVETKELPKIETKEIEKLWGRKPIHKQAKVVWPKESLAMETA